MKKRSHPKCRVCGGRLVLEVDVVRGKCHSCVANQNATRKRHNPVAEAIRKVERVAHHLEQAALFQQQVLDSGTKLPDMGALAAALKATERAQKALTGVLAASGGKGPRE